MMRPGIPAPSIAPLMGTRTIRAREGVEYKELTARSLLNRCDSPRMPFRWTVNPYRGCAMGCRYCYAAYTHEFMGIATPERFHSTIFVKTEGEEETARRLSRIVRKGELVALGTATDPYQPGEAEFGVTRRFLKLASQYRNLRLGVTTKGALILRDLDLLRRIHERSTLDVHVSLVSSDRELLRKLEPWAPPPDVRIEVMRRLGEAGIPVSLALAPVLPALTDLEDDLSRLLDRVVAAGVKRMSCNILFLRSPTKEKYLRWLAAEFPQFLEAYERAYSASVYLRGGYAQKIRALVDRLALKHGLEPAFGKEPSKAQKAQQLSFCG